MKRYDHFCSLDGGGPAEAEESPDGEFVRYDDAVAARDAAVAAERERNAGWFALVMNAAASLEDAAIFLRDPDAKRAAEGAAKHYRQAANALWEECDA